VKQLRDDDARTRKTSRETEFEMVGTVPAMKEVFESVRRVSSMDALVFFSGESGTGKELAARHNKHKAKSAADELGVSGNALSTDGKTRPRAHRRARNDNAPLGMTRYVVTLSANAERAGPVMTFSRGNRI
jgi:hypothetical protein